MMIASVLELPLEELLQCMETDLKDELFASFVFYSEPRTLDILSSSKLVCGHFQSFLMSSQTAVWPRVVHIPTWSQ